MIVCQSTLDASYPTDTEPMFHIHPQLLSVLSPFVCIVLDYVIVCLGGIIVQISSACLKIV